MKKYLTPSVKYVTLNTESLIALSAKDESFGSESDILTQKQDQKQGGNSLWDTWSN